jgi:hypothetical protein
MAAVGSRVAAVGSRVAAVARQAARYAESRFRAPTTAQGSAAHARVAVRTAWAVCIGPLVGTQSNLIGDTLAFAVEERRQQLVGIVSLADLARAARGGAASHSEEVVSERDVGHTLASICEPGRPRIESPP